MRQGGPPISFRPGAGAQMQQPAFGGNAQPQMQQQNWGGRGGPMPTFGNQQQQFGIPQGQGPSKIGMNNQNPQQPAPIAKSKMFNPITGSNMEQKYVNHLNTLEKHIANELRALPGTQMVNATRDQANYELFLVISYTVKSKTGDIPVYCKVAHRFPGEAPKLYCLNPVRHSIVNASNLEIDYKKYYNFGQNGKIIDLLTSTVAYFDKNPIENSVIDKKIAGLEAGLNAKDFMDLKNSSITAFYDQLTPNEKKDFQDDAKRLAL